MAKYRRQSFRTGAMEEGIYSRSCGKVSSEIRDSLTPLG
jgi:hypothetical protein